MINSGNKSLRSGFTLVELSIALVIVSILLGTIVFSVQTRLNDSKLYLTKERMQLVMDALDNYVEQYGHLPCPAPMGISLSADYGKRTSVDYGQDYGSNTGACTDGVDGRSSFNGANITSGVVPFKSLGLESQDAVDGWGMRFNYIVTQQYTLQSNLSDPGTIAGGGYGLHDGSGIDMDIAYVLISHGANTYGAYRDKDGAKLPNDGSDSETDNASYDSIDFCLYPLAGDVSFDDILVYKLRSQLPAYINE